MDAVLIQSYAMRILLCAIYAAILLCCSSFFLSPTGLKTKDLYFNTTCTNPILLFLVNTIVNFYVQILLIEEIG